MNGDRLLGVFHPPDRQRRKDAVKCRLERIC